LINQGVFYLILLILFLSLAQAKTKVIYDANGVLNILLPSPYDQFYGFTALARVVSFIKQMNGSRKQKGGFSRTEVINWQGRVEMTTLPEKWFHAEW